MCKPKQITLVSMNGIEKTSNKLWSKNLIAVINKLTTDVMEHTFSTRPTIKGSGVYLMPLQEHITKNTVVAKYYNSKMFNIKY